MKMAGVFIRQSRIPTKTRDTPMLINRGFFIRGQHKAHHGWKLLLAGVQHLHAGFQLESRVQSCAAALLGAGRAEEVLQTSEAGLHKAQVVHHTFPRLTQMPSGFPWGKNKLDTHVLLVAYPLKLQALGKLIVYRHIAHVTPKKLKSCVFKR